MATHKQKRDIRYAVVRNATYDPELAKQARDWSDKRIYETFGVRVPSTTPKLKDIKPSRKRQAQLRQEKLDELKEMGVSIEKANQLKYKSWEAIAFKYPTSNVLNKRRKKRWSEWSKKGGKFPPYIKNMTRQVNLNRGFDENARYGWAVIYEAYRHGNPPDWWENWITPDRFTPDIYTYGGRYGKH